LIESTNSHRDRDHGNFCLRRLEGVTPNLDEFRAVVTEIVNNGTRASAVISRIRALLMKGASSRTELDINEVIQEVAILLRNERPGIVYPCGLISATIFHA